MNQTRRPGRYLAWIIAMLLVAAVVGLPIDFDMQLVVVLGVLVGALPLGVRVVQSVRERRADVAPSALAAGAAWLLTGHVTLAWFAVLGGLVVTFAAASVRSALRQRLGQTFDPRPPLVRVTRTSREELVAYGAVHPGDRVVVQAGERVPVDGELVSTTAKVRRAFRDRINVISAGENVTSGDVAITQLVLVASHVGREATWSILSALVGRLAAALPVGLQRLEQSFMWVQLAWIAAAVLVVLTAAATADERGRLAWLIVVGAWWLGPLLARGVLASLTVSRMRRGLLPKNWSLIERSRRLSVALLDKTGMLTAGEPRLVEVYPAAEQLTREDVLRLGAALERDVDHPIARTVRRAAASAGLAAPQVTERKLVPGGGVVGHVAGETFTIGTARLAEQGGATVSEDVSQAAVRHEQQGATVVLLAQSAPVARVLGVLVLSDVPRPSAAAMVHGLAARGITPELMTSDEPLPARAVATAVGIGPGHVRSPLTPKEKVAAAAELRSQGLLVVADPVADRAALAQATLGVGFAGQGPTLTDPSTQVLIRSDDLTLVNELLNYARQLRALPWLTLVGNVVLTAALTAAVLAL